MSMIDRLTLVSTLQVSDLLGMQSANLLNLPENYTFKYCQSLAVNQSLKKTWL